MTRRKLHLKESLLPKIVDKNEMRGRIMDAAMTCFSRNGYHAAKMTDVATEAGLAKGTLYLYFPGKDELTVALLERYFDGLQETVQAEPMPKDLGGFLTSLRGSLQLSQDRQGKTRLFFDILGPGFELPQGRQVIGAFFRRLGAHYAAALEHLKQGGEVRRDIDCATAGAAIAAMADGLVIHLALFDQDRSDYAARLDAAISLLADGLRTR